MKIRLWAVACAVLLAAAGGLLYWRQVRPPQAAPGAVSVPAKPVAASEQPAPALQNAPGLIPADQKIVYIADGQGKAAVLAVAVDDPGQTSLWLLDWNLAEPRMKQVFAGADSGAIGPPAWVNYGTALVYQFSAGDCMGKNPAACGIFMLQSTGETIRLAGYRTAGLAAAPESSLLAYWDRAPGVQPVLTVLDYSKKREVKSWLGQSELDCAPKNLAFSPDGQSLYAQTCDHGSFPLMEYSLRAGEAKQRSKNVTGPVAASNGVYFIERGAAPESSRLLRIADSGAEPSVVANPFPYETLSAIASSPWLTAYSASSGLVLFDTNTQSGFPLGKSCRAVTLVRQEPQFAAGNRFVSDAKECGAPARGPFWGPAIAEKVTQLQTLREKAEKATTAPEKADGWFALNQSADELAKIMNGSGQPLIQMFTPLAETASAAGVEIRYCEIGESWGALSSGFEKYSELWPDGPKADEAWWKSHMESWCGDFEGSADEYKAMVDLYSDFLKRFPSSAHAAEAGKRLKENQAGLEQAMREEQAAQPPKKKP